MLFICKIVKKGWTHYKNHHRVLFLRIASTHRFCASSEDHGCVTEILYLTDLWELSSTSQRKLFRFLSYFWSYDLWKYVQPFTISLHFISFFIIFKIAYLTLNLWHAILLITYSRESYFSFHRSIRNLLALH